jgi:hypothetical protein
MKHRALVLLHLCVNNTNGMCSGELAQLQLGKDATMTLEAMWWNEDREDFGGPEFCYHFHTVPDWNRPGASWSMYRCRGQIQIMRRRFEFYYYRPHVGNIMWDVVAIKAKDCVRLLRWLRRHDWFVCTEAPSELWDLYHSKSEIKLKHIYLL